MKNACCWLVSNGSIKQIYGCASHTKRRGVCRRDTFAVMLISDVQLCKKNEQRQKGEKRSRYVEGEEPQWKLGHKKEWTK